MEKIFETYWGIDVSKEWVDVDTGCEIIRICQTKKEINRLIKKHTKLEAQKTLVVLESTGGYERLVAKSLSEKGFQIHIAHPNKVKAFARAKGKLAKSDRIDAKILREYGAFLREDEIKGLPSQKQRELTLLGARLEQSKEAHHQECCRLGMADGKVIKASIKEMLSLLKKQINLVERSIDELIKADTQLKERYEILCSMKGVGPRVAMKLITDLPELGETNKKEIAALVGVAPITNESGQKVKKAMIRYGRFSVRRSLYMGALVASKHNEKLKNFYIKLIAGGKPPKVALVAVMRKMIVILNVMVQKKEHFYA